MLKFETSCKQNKEFWTGQKTFNKQSTKFVNTYLSNQKKYDTSVIFLSN